MDTLLVILVALTTVAIPALTEIAAAGEEQRVKSLREVSAASSPTGQ
jgi:O-antigen/teichoic acid export membrane protein